LEQAAPPEPQAIEPENAEDVAENQVEVVPEQNSFLHLEIPEDELMNDEEIQEAYNEQNMD
jgi:hypothetical protein